MRYVASHEALGVIYAVDSSLCLVLSCPLLFFLLALPTLGFVVLVMVSVCGLITNFGIPSLLYIYIYIIHLYIHINFKYKNIKFYVAV